MVEKTLPIEIDLDNGDGRWVANITPQGQTIILTRFHINYNGCNSNIQ